jgi:hypothetical protein
LGGFCFVHGSLPHIPVLHDICASLHFMYLCREKTRLHGCNSRKYASCISDILAMTYMDVGNAERLQDEYRKYSVEIVWNKISSDRCPWRSVENCSIHIRHFRHDLHGCRKCRTNTGSIRLKSSGTRFLAIAAPGGRRILFPTYSTFPPSLAVSHAYMCFQLACRFSVCLHGDRALVYYSAIH